MNRPLVAVVDDDASVCKSLARMLRAAQMDVLTYDSGGDFLRNGEHRNPDCLVLDIHMPEMTGIELRDELKAHPRRIPIVFITAYDNGAVEKVAVSGGGAGYLRKPFNDTELLASIAQALDRTSSGVP
jgi:FixJ family two-component response regulator